MMADFSEPITLTTPSGADLRLYGQTSDTAPRAIIQINHGLAEHAARYERFARLLAANRFAVYAHDHRGHGHTRAPDAPQGRFSKAGAGMGWKPVIDDSIAVIDHATNQFPDTPVIIFGHSMGALVAANIAISYPNRPTALALWNDTIPARAAITLARFVLAIERMVLGSDVPSRIMPKTSFEAWGKSVVDHQTNFDWLSHDPEQVKAYIDDPLCGWNASVSMWQDILAMGARTRDNDELSRLRRNLPIQLIGGGQDPASEKGGTVRALSERLKTLGFSDVTTTIYPEMRHETLNESAPPGAQGATQDFITWLDRVI